MYAARHVWYLSATKKEAPTLTLLDTRTSLSWYPCLITLFVCLYLTRSDLRQDELKRQLIARSNWQPVQVCQPEPPSRSLVLDQHSNSYIVISCRCTRMDIVTVSVYVSLLSC